MLLWLKYLPLITVTMATGGGGSPLLWDRDNPKQQGLVCTDERFKDLLNNKRCRLCGSLTLSTMWPALRQLEVISERQEQDMKVITIIKISKTIHKFCHMSVT